MTPCEILLVYDRECPVCNAYCRLVRIRKSAGALRLVDARHAGAVILYPMLRFFRNLLLKALRKTKINNLRREDNERF